MCRTMMLKIRFRVSLKRCRNNLRTPALIAHTHTHYRKSCVLGHPRSLVSTNSCRTLAQLLLLVLKPLQQ